MNGDKLLAIIGSIVTVALVTTIVVHGAGFSTAITGAGNAFGNSLRAAMGN